MNVTRENTEIFDQAHQMYAEGACDSYPLYSDIKGVLEPEGFYAHDIESWYDVLQGFYRWRCKITRK